MGLEKYYGVLVGGIIGFLSAFVLELIKIIWEYKKENDQTQRLSEILYEEVEQQAELLDIDLGVVEHSSLDFLLEFGKGTDECDGKLKQIIARLRSNRIIFDSQAERLLQLPGYLPNSLVRFYNRLQVNCIKMNEAIDTGNLDALKKLRIVSANEANVLKTDLRAAFK